MVKASRFLSVAEINIGKPNAGPAHRFAVARRIDDVGRQRGEDAAVAFDLVQRQRRGFFRRGRSGGGCRRGRLIGGGFIPDLRWSWLGFIIPRGPRLNREAEGRPWPGGCERDRRFGVVYSVDREVHATAGEEAGATEYQAMGLLSSFSDWLRPVVGMAAGGDRAAGAARQAGARGTTFQSAKA